MVQAIAQSCEFATVRLRVGPWHAIAQDARVDLAAAVAAMLTEATTRGLPARWQGDFSAERAQVWIDERDLESSTLLVVERDSAQPIGLIILFELPINASSIDLRIGYLLTEPAWGQGLASELVDGLVTWARARPSIRTLTGGVAADNPASARVLVKNGFQKAPESGGRDDIYELSLEQGSEWDQHAATWDEDEATRAYAAAAFESLHAVVAGAALTLGGARVCDFGCGTGLLTEHLVRTGAVVDAVDTSTAMLAVLRAKIERYKWAGVRASANVPEAPTSYDLIVCSSVCSFLDDYPAAVRQLASLLRPGGVFVQWDWERDEADPDAGGLTRAEINDSLASAGLAAISVGTAFEISVGGTTMRPLMGRAQRPAEPGSL